MRGSVSLTIKKNDFRKIAGAMPNKTSAVIRKTAFDIITIATPNTPVETGFLRNSASVQMESEFLAIVMWAAHYARFQEFGTRWIAPKLFATGAAESVRPGFVSAMKQMLAGLGG